MANDPPALPSLPELADLDPAFDLTTFATERDNGHGPPGDLPAPAGEAAARVEDLPRIGDASWREASLPTTETPDIARPWLTESRVQLGVAGFLAIGGIAIVLLAFRGSGAPAVSPATSANPPVTAPTAESRTPAVAEPAIDPPAAESPTAPAPPAPAARKREAPAAAAPIKESADASPAQVPARARPRSSSGRDAGAAISTGGRRVRTSEAPGTAGRRAASTPPVRPWVAAATIEQSTMNVNALPWANVWVDGRPVGETPLANIRVPVGDHEVIFRHPELGERRVRAVVEAGVAARVTVDLRR